MGGITFCEKGGKKILKNKLLFKCLVTVIILVILNGCNAKQDETLHTPARTEKNQVLIQGYKFQPDILTIQKGDTVTWTNQDSVKHNATNNSFDTGLLSKGQSAQQTFNETGTFDYFCTPHPYMKGKIIVKEEL